MGVQFYQMHLLHLFKGPHVFPLLIYYCSKLLPWISQFYAILTYLEEAQLRGQVLPFTRTVEVDYVFGISTSVFTSEANL